MKRQGSGFASLPGLAVLAALVLVSAYLEARLLEGLLIAAFLLCGLALLWARFALAKIRVQFKGQDCRGFPGSTLTVPAELHNEKALPLVWLEAAFAGNGGDCVRFMPEEGKEEREQAREVFLWLMPWQSLYWEQRLTALRRGVFTVNGIDLSSGDGFGLRECRKNIPLDNPFRFVVYPALCPVDTGPMRRRLRELELARGGIIADNTLLRNVRDYRAGDSVRDINWRLLARQDKLQVNVRGTLDTRRLCFLPDLESFTHIEKVERDGQQVERRKADSEDIEKLLSLIASAIADLDSRGILCSLVLPEWEGSPARLVMPESASVQVPELLTALAEIDYQGEGTRFPLPEMMEKNHALGQFFLFTRNNSGRCSALSDGLDGLPLLLVVRDLEGAVPDARILPETELCPV